MGAWKWKQIPDCGVGGWNRTSRRLPENLAGYRLCNAQDQLSMRGNMGLYKNHFH
ncbi:Uncharacterised protein [Sphingobacterium daejeonense]|nr:Uncharacterised protein [Sphingobacterium daejeonense]